MKRCLMPGLWVFLTVPFSVMAQSAEFGAMESRADSLFNAFAEEEALEVYEQILEQDSTNYRALWRTSLLYSRVGNRQEEEGEQRRYFQKGIKLAEMALEEDSTDAESNFVMAVAMGRKALISGARDRVAASREIKKYVDRALEIDGRHSGAHHVLGRWHLRIANLNFAERAAANVLFGGLSGNASNEKALEHIQKAIDLRPDFVLYHHDLSLVYEELGNEEEAIEACRAALDVPSRTPEDEEHKEACMDRIGEME